MTAFVIAAAAYLLLALVSDILYNRPGGKK
jgi:hypothetical protein